MSRYVMEAHHIDHHLFTPPQIRRRVDELVLEIARDCQSDNLVIIGVLRGSFMFLADLVRGMNQHGMHPRIDFVTLESYAGGFVSTGTVRVAKDITVDVTDADCVLVDDILDTGRTLSFGISYLLERGARSVKTCTLLDKPARRVVEVSADYVGFTIPDVFVVGYGLDYEHYYRELPFIAEVTLLEEEG